MAGIIAGSVGGAGWSPVQDRSNVEFPARSAAGPSPLAFTEEPEAIEEDHKVDVPTLKVPEPPARASKS